MSTTTKKAARPTQPQDHQPPTEDREPEGHTVKVRGREWFVPSDALNDFELLDDIAVIQSESSESVARLAPALRRLVGAEQWRDAMNVCRNDDGRVTVEEGGRFLLELLGALNPNS